MVNVSGPTATRRRPRPSRRARSQRSCCGICGRFPPSPNCTSISWPGAMSTSTLQYSVNRRGTATTAGNPLDRRRCHVGVQAAGRPQVDARGGDHADADRRRLSGETAHRADRDVAPVQGGRGDGPVTGLALEPQCRPLLRRQERARVHPVQPDLLGAAAAAGHRSGPTAFPPPPSCTRPRARPSRAGAPDAPRDGNAAHASAGPSAPCRAHLGALSHLPGGVRRRLGCARADRTCALPRRSAAPAGARTPRRDVRRAVSVEP